MGQANFCALKPMTQILWTFTEQVARVRADRLLAFDSFLAVQKLVIATLRIRDVASEKYQGADLKGCKRAAFLLEVSHSAYDAFFNSPAGLRGQYAISPAQGETANRRLLTSLLPSLLEARVQTGALEEEAILWSLAGSQAKIWIYEDEVYEQLGGTRPAIDYAPWAAASETGVGLLAPVGCRLQVMGAWIDGAGTVVSNPSKEGRSLEIHRTGFS